MKIYGSVFNRTKDISKITKMSDTSISDLSGYVSDCNSIWHSRV